MARGARGVPGRGRVRRACRRRGGKRAGHRGRWRTRRGATRGGVGGVTIKIIRVVLFSRVSRFRPGASVSARREVPPVYGNRNSRASLRFARCEKSSRRARTSPFSQLTAKAAADQRSEDVRPLTPSVFDRASRSPSAASLARARAASALHFRRHTRKPYSPLFSRHPAGLADPRSTSSGSMPRATGCSTSSAASSPRSPPPARTSSASASPCASSSATA